MITVRGLKGHTAKTPASCWCLKHNQLPNWEPAPLLSVREPTAGPSPPPQLLCGCRPTCRTCGGCYWTWSPRWFSAWDCLLKAWLPSTLLETCFWRGDAEVCICWSLFITTKTLLEGKKKIGENNVFFSLLLLVFPVPPTDRTEWDSC